MKVGWKTMTSYILHPPPLHPLEHPGTPLPPAPPNTSLRPVLSQDLPKTKSPKHFIEIKLEAENHILIIYSFYIRLYFRWDWW